MDITSFAILLGIAISGLTTAVTFGRNPSDPLNRTFLAWGGATFLWGAGILLRLYSTSCPSAMVFFSIGMAGAMATVAIYFFFTMVFLDRVVSPPAPRTLFGVLTGLVFLSGAGFFITVPATSWVVADFAFDARHSSAETGPGFRAIILWAMFTVAIAFLMVVIFYRRIEAGRERKQAHAVAAAPIVPVLFYGVAEFTLSSTATGILLGEAYMATVLFTFVIAYGILRHRLMVITPEMAADQVLEALPDGVALVDLGGVVKNANRAFQDLLGRSEEEILGEAIWDFVEGEENPESGKARAGSTTRLEFQFGVRTPEGEMIPVAATYEPLSNPDGEPVGSIAVLRDLRGTRRLQAELIQAEKLAGLGELVAGVAHEFNSPLTVMLGLSEMGAKTSEGEKARRSFQQIFDQAVRAREIVAKLLQFARKGEGKRVVVDVRQLIEEAVELTKLSVKTENVTVHTAFTDGEALIFCSADEIRQVFVNLLQNAFHAILGDGTTGAVTLSTLREEGWVTIRLTDDGPGIPDEFRLKIFDPFFTTKEVGKGTGLGLSICHGIVKDHGGRIGVESNPDRGVTFTLNFPEAINQESGRAHREK